MAFLLLNCTRKSESGSTYKSEQYTASLREQYEILQHKYAGLKSAGFETFVQTCCNAALPKRYFLSMPDILRGGVNGDYYNNIVLRPESDPAMSAILPQNVDVIFIGDINMRYGEFVVKGFEVLDKNVHKYGEKEISGVARCAFTTKVLPSNAAVPNYGFQLEPGASLFTRDVILELTTENYPVPVPADLINIYEQWKEYIEFRKYYLEQLGNDRIPVAGCDTVSAFALKKSLYDKNREKYQAYLLDDLAEFEKNDMVLLEKEVDEAESFPLVRVIVEKNRKELFSAMSLRRKDKPAFEMRLNRFTREAVALAGEAPSGRNGKPALEFLDERYRLYHKDIEPDYSDINEQEQAEISAQYRRIDQRYNNEIAVQSAGKKREESARIDAENDKKKDAFKEKDGKKKKGDNGKEYAEFIKKLEADKERVLEETITQFEKTLYSQCEPRIKEEKQRIQSEIQKKYAPAREAKKENETLRRYYIYFKIPGDEKELQKRITALKPISLVYDQRAEKAKIKRQETSLNNFFKGYVKNPFLAAYLFAPQEIKPASAAGAVQDISFFSDRLNDTQKEAVRKALASDSIFLIQGPPGTGKTEVIAEITAQFVKSGKRVLISSETHKAIDNVFDRLPRISEIRPLRLIPSNSNKSKDNNYAPENLVDNFYRNISDGLNTEIEKFEHFAEYKEKFGETFKELKVRFEKIEKERRLVSEAEGRISALERNIKDAEERLGLEKEKRNALIEDKNDLVTAERRIDTFSFQSDDSDPDVNGFKRDVDACLKEFPCFIQSVYAAGELYGVDIDSIKAELAAMESNPEAVSLRVEHAKISERIKLLTDEYTGEALPGKEEEHRELRGKFIAIGKQLKEKERNSGVSLNDTSVSKLLAKDKITPEILKGLPEMFLQFKQKAREIKSRYASNIEQRKNAKQSEILDCEDRISAAEKEIRQKKGMINHEKENCDYENFYKNESGLKIKIAAFFADFHISSDAGSGSIASQLELMEREWRNLENDYTKKDAENRGKIPMYRKIVKYLKTGALLENDRHKYTKLLFDNVNVYGITSTSRDNFNSGTIESFAKYNIEGLDIKQQSIDVVIIDEVSKSPLLDLLIPILYGKTVILVGDHRQLPPLYDLKHLKDEDFEELKQRTSADDATEEQQPRYTREDNKAFTDLYEESFFKTLMYKVPDSLRITLNKQYRCHEHIMRVFNHFYMNISRKGTLELGLKNQNDYKQHGVSVFIKGQPVIEPQKHIYFIDCSDSYESFSDGSTSASNKTEAEAITVLAKEINFSLGSLSSTQKVNKERGKDERLSMGVICTYGDQVRLIKNTLKRNQLKNINELPEEKFIISTVDDFQGDERDIIFVSLVRNPEPKKRGQTRADFVKQFERINVALSRARRMLIIAGSKDFLKDITIDLPDMNGKPDLGLKNYPVYKEIIDTIALYGTITSAKNVIGRSEK